VGGMRAWKPPRARHGNRTRSGSSGLAGMESGHCGRMSRDWAYVSEVVTFDERRKPIALSLDMCLAT